MKSVKLIPKIGIPWYQYLQFGWNLVALELVPVPKTLPCHPPLQVLANSPWIVSKSSSFGFALLALNIDFRTPSFLFGKGLIQRYF